MTTLRRPDIPTKTQRDRFPRWRLLLQHWDTGHYSVATLAEKLGISRFNLWGQLQSALRARQKGWV